MSEQLDSTPIVLDILSAIIDVLIKKKNTKHNVNVMVGCSLQSNTNINTITQQGSLRLLLAVLCLLARTWDA